MEITREEAKKYLIRPVATSTEPSKEYLKQKAAYDMAMTALNKMKYKEFCEWVAKEIISEDEWENNSNAFPELACRRLNELDIIDTDGEHWFIRKEN